MLLEIFSQSDWGDALIRSGQSLKPGPLVAVGACVTRPNRFAEDQKRRSKQSHEVEGEQ
jgi:hypothetical protein